VQFKPGYLDNPPDGDVEPQLAERYEFADPQTLTFHLRKDAKWDQRAPTSSRPVDARDVVFSWKKFEAQSNSAESLAHSASKFAPVESINAIDDHTVQVKLAFRTGLILPSLAFNRWLQIMPRESDGGFDPRQEMRGAGPWYLETWDRSTRMNFRKNPNYWAKDRPFVDGYDGPIIGEYAQRLAQFRAGKIYGGVVAQNDIIATKEEIPELNVFQGEYGRGNWQIYFGLRPNSPFRDERVRRAVSMLIDRDQILDTFNQVSDFTKKGWPIATRWHSVGVSAGFNA
jgi:ABC-type transport system substrate-binding protein